MKPKAKPGEKETTLIRILLRTIRDITCKALKQSQVVKKCSRKLAHTIIAIIFNYPSKEPGT
jgi:hypothetical protein